jgi:glycosyltransferase involved in cell wall biosynthesis
MKKLISIINPVYNESENIDELIQRVSSVMQETNYEYEHLFIDNCSTDETLRKLKEIAKKNKKIKIIANTRNFGYIRSSFHALLQAKGDGVVLIASDLQDPPEMILEFIAQWESGFKIVMAVKPVSEESKFIFYLRRMFYKSISKISEVNLIQNATGSGLFDSGVIEILRKINDPYPYFRGLLCELGYPIATVKFKQPKRIRGITSQNFYSLYDMAMLGITKHSKIPLRIMTILGFAISILSLFVASCFLIAKLLFWNLFSLGIAPTLIGIFFFGGMQMLFLGMLGEYIGTIQTQVRNMPHVIEAERINF